MFMIARKINKLFFYAIFSKQNKNNWITSNCDIIYLQAADSKVFLSAMYFEQHEPVKE